MRPLVLTSAHDIGWLACTVAVSIADVNKDKDKFVENFSKDVAVALKVDQARIGVTGITAGSVRRTLPSVSGSCDSSISGPVSNV